MAASMREGESNSTDADKGTILEPLTFDIAANEVPGQESEDTPQPCLLCSEMFSLVRPADDFFRHLLTEHKLVIADCKQIPDLPKYVDYWRDRFHGKSITDFCVGIKTNSKDTDPEPSELYYLLCDALPEDKDLRLKLQHQRLEEALSQQQREREDAEFSRSCLFCKEHFEGNRVAIFHHLNESHNFNVGHPDNLVYKEDLLDVLQYKLDSCVCLYCEKTFKDRHVLKEHMRKKQHKKINSKNSAYDRFYIINYLELGKNWEDIQSEDDRDVPNTSVEESDLWADWQEDGLDSSQTNAVCLFCEETAAPSTILEHLKSEHQFNITQHKVDLQLTFYQQVKLVNYIRRQIHLNTCSYCEQKFPSRAALHDHMTESGHTRVIPALKIWDQPEYFFPTYENDNLLCGLEDEDDANLSGSASEVTAVIAEDLPVAEAIQRREELMQELLN